MVLFKIYIACNFVQEHKVYNIVCPGCVPVPVHGVNKIISMSWMRTRTCTWAYCLSWVRPVHCLSWMFTCTCTWAYCLSWMRTCTCTCTWVWLVPQTPPAISASQRILASPLGKSLALARNLFVIVLFLYIYILKICILLFVTLFFNVFLWNKLENWKSDHHI